MSEAPNVNPLEQVQSILFGRQMQEITKRFEALDARLTQKTNEVLGELRERVAALEKDAQDRERALRDALKSQGQEGASGLASVKALLQDGESALRGQIDQLKEDLGREVAKLTDDKPDRVALSEMLMDVAQRLGGKSKTDG